MKEPRLALDWSAWDGYGQGDAYAGLPAHGGGFGKAAALCIGSRSCQRADGAGLMCPSYRVTREDTHSTRARAATLRQALDGALGEQPFNHPALAEAMDLCVACKGCKRECPNGVDMAALRTEVLAQRWQQQPMPLRERLFARLPRWLPWLRRARGLLALRNRVPALARLGERWLGLAAGRPLPLPAERAWLDGPTPLTAPPVSAQREVLLLVDSFSNHFAPAAVQAAVELLQAAGCRVHPLRPPAGAPPLCCGRSALAQGDVAQARAELGRLLAAAEPWLARGLPLIGLEPACLLTLRDEALQLGLGEPAARAARQAFLLEEFLAREIDPARLPWQRLDRTVAVHGHCHEKAFGAMKSLRKVLGWVPGLQAQFIESSCCGMAGGFGLEAEHHAVSLRMAEAALLPAVRALPADAWVLANGSSCRHQILDGSGREALTLAQVLRAALP